MSKDKEKTEETIQVVNWQHPETDEERQAREQREAFIKRNDEARKARQEILKRNNLPDDTRELTEDEIQKRCCG